MNPSKRRVPHRDSSRTLHSQRNALSLLSPWHPVTCLLLLGGLLFLAMSLISTLGGFVSHSNVVDYRDQPPTLWASSSSSSSSSYRSRSSFLFVHAANATVTHSMTTNAWVTVATCVAVLLALSFRVVDCAPAMIMSSVFLYLTGVVSFSDVLYGLSNSSVTTIALLFIVVDPIADLPKVRQGVAVVLGDLNTEAGERLATFKIVVLCLLTSSFLNNAPQVAVLTNLVKTYCRECGGSPSQILLPMNFATLCGNYALIGTSTNLIVDGLMQKYHLGNMPFFELLKINGPFTVLMVTYLVFMPRYLLPRRAGGMFRAMRERVGTFLSHLRVKPGSIVIGFSVNQLMERNKETIMQNIEIIQIERGGGFAGAAEESPLGEDSSRHREPTASFSNVNSAVATDSPKTNRKTTLFPLTGDEVLQEGDILLVRGPISLVRDLDTLFGLEWRILAANEVDTAVRDGITRTRGISVHHPHGSSTDLVEMQPITTVTASTPVEDGTPVPDNLNASRTRHFSVPPAGPSTTVAQMKHAISHAHSLSQTSFSENPLPVARPELTHSFGFGLQGPQLTTRAVDPGAQHTTFFEVVIGPRCASLNTTVASGHFQTHYNASLLAVRSVEGLHSVDMYGSDLAVHVLEVGDTALILARATFHDEWNELGDFIGINEIESTVAKRVEEHYVRLPSWLTCIGSRITLHDDVAVNVVQLPAWYPYISILIFAIMLGFAIYGYDLAMLAMLATIASVILGLITTSRAIEAIEWEVILMVAFSFTLATAMEKSGFSAVIGSTLKEAQVTGIALLYLISILATFMTNVITNKACVQVLVPLVVATYRDQGLDPIPAVIMLTSLASMALSTPYGFATNLMVMGPGGYTPLDFIKFGLPLNLLATAVIPIITALVYGMKW